MRETRVLVILLLLREYVIWRKYGETATKVTREMEKEKETKRKRPSKIMKKREK